jgi:phage tail sheath protein FI
MPDYTTPGVEVIEDHRGSRPIDALDTDVAGFVGVTASGPTAPTLVRSWPEFEETFGGVIDQAPFATPY